MGMPAGPFAHLTPAAADSALPQEGEPYAIVFEHGTLEVGWYAPRGIDDQQPHRRDEVYVVAAGTARFVADGQPERAISVGDVLFIAALCGHRFLEMSSDFKTWVMFYGPDGGE